MDLKALLKEHIIDFWNDGTSSDDPTRIMEIDELNNFLSKVPMKEVLDTFINNRVERYSKDSDSKYLPSDKYFTFGAHPYRFIVLPDISAVIDYVKTILGKYFESDFKKFCEDNNILVESEAITIESAEEENADEMLVYQQGTWENRAFNYLINYLGEEKARFDRHEVQDEFVVLDYGLTENDDLTWSIGLVNEEGKLGYNPQVKEFTYPLTEKGLKDAFRRLDIPFNVV